MLDTNCPWTPAEAIAMARAPRSRTELFWLEEPVWPPEDYRGPRPKWRAATDTPIALGENESTALRVPRDRRPGEPPISCSRASPRSAGSPSSRRSPRSPRPAEPAGGPALLLRGAGAGRDPPPGRGHGRRSCRSSSPPAATETSLLARPIAARGRHGRGAHRPRPRRRDQRGRYPEHPYAPAAAPPLRPRDRAPAPRPGRTPTAS